MAAPAQRDFRLGEVAPSFYGRADLGMYGSGLRTLRNAYVKRMGGITSRPGTLYKGTTKGSGAVVLVDAVFDDTENYVLEFGNLYVRVWKNGALVTVGTPAAWATATAYTAGAVRSNGGTNYVCILAHTSGSSTEPGVGASWQTNWYALSGTTFEYPTDYTTAQLSALQFAAQYRVVTIVHPSHPPATLTFDANGLAVLADIDFSTPLEFPTNVAVTPSGTGGEILFAVTAVYADGGESTISASVDTGATILGTSLFDPFVITWSAVTEATGYNVYQFFLGGWSRVNTSLITATTFTKYGPYAGGTEYAPSAPPLFGGAGAYPGTVGAYQQRLLLSGTLDNPDVVYASKSALPYDFTTHDPLRDDDSTTWRQVGQRLNRVRFFREVAQRLIQFSSVGEVIVQGDVDGILRPGEVNPRILSEHGISPTVPPLVVGDAALYVQARGNQVQDLWPDGSGSEISRTAWHLLDGYEVVSWCFQRVPDRVVWAVRDDGKLLSLTYNREDQVLGWATHDTDGSFERVVCVPEGDEDAVYAVVARHPLPTEWSNANAPSQIYSASAYSPSLGVAVLLGDNSNTASNVAAYGSTGSAWTSTTAGTTDYSYTDAVWFPAGGVFVGVSAASGQSNNAVSSPTGAVWTARALDDDDWRSCFCATVAGTPCVIALGATKVGITVDGTTWNAVAATGDYVNPTRGCWADGLDAAYAIDNAGARLITTTDVVAWSEVTVTGGSGSYHDVQWAGDRLVVLDQNGSVFWTTDGVTFNEVVVGNVDRMSYDTTSGLLFAFEQYNTPNTVTVSEDSGLSWLALPDPTVTFDDPFATGVYMPNVKRYVLAGAQQTTTEAAYVEFPVTARYVERFTNRLADVPVAMDAALSVTSVTTTLTGLSHLEGRTVSIATASGGVVASPYNPAYSAAVVSGGQVSVPASGTYWVGLPIVTDVETLDIETVNGTRKDAGILVNRIGLWLEDTLGLSARATAPSSSTSLDGFQSLPVVDEDGNTTTTPVTGYREVTVDGVWTRGGRIFLRNVDPTPVTIHSIAVQGQFGRS